MKRFAASREGQHARGSQSRGVIVVMTLLGSVILVFSHAFYTSLAADPRLQLHQGYQTLNTARPSFRSQAKAAETVLHLDDGYSGESQSTDAEYHRGTRGATQEWTLPWEVEEEPTHLSRDLRVLQGVGGTDIPCPGQTQGPDEGACQIKCPGDGDCGVARGVCEGLAGCIGYTTNREGTWATLKGRVTWVRPVTPTANFAKCQDILRSGRTEGWDTYWCPDFIVEEHTQIRPFYVLPHGRREIQSQRLDMSSVTCPAPSNGLLFLTFQNGPSGHLCRFLHLAANNRLPVTVLGWEPAAGRRWGEFYLGSKVVSTLFLLESCRYSSDTIVVFSDTDALIQGSVSDFKREAEHLLPEGSKVRMLMATELSLEVAPKHARRFKELAPQDAVYNHLNSGGYIGRVDTIKSFLEEVASGRAYDQPRAERFSGTIEQLQQQRVRHNSDGIPTVYRVNDQATFAEVLKDDMWHGTVSMDYHVHMFMSMFGRPAHKDLAVEGGRLVNVKANTTPLLVHYNGQAKDPTHTPAHLSMDVMYRSLRGEASPSALEWEGMSRLINFLDPAFQPVAVDLKATCGAHI